MTPDEKAVTSVAAATMLVRLRRRCGGGRHGGGVFGHDQLVQPPVARRLPVGACGEGGVCTENKGRIKQGGTQHVTSEGRT